MTKEEFQQLTKRVMVLDGATGSNLFRHGMPRGVCAEQWILEHEDVMIELQRQYVDAGSQVVLAPTFGANRAMLENFDLGTRMREMNLRLVELSQRAVEGRAYVAGDLTCSAKVIGSCPETTYERALERYREQLEYLAEAGVDLVMAETMTSSEEVMAALEAAKEVCDLPVLCSMTVESDGSLYAGGNVYEAAESLEALGADAVGINCSAGPDQLEAVVAGIRSRVKIPVIAKPNAGMPTITDQGEAVYSMEPENFAVYMRSLLNAGADIVGGCCGTTPEFIRELCRVLR